MKTLTPLELIPFLRKIIQNKVLVPTFMWSPPGIGKSSIVKALAEEFERGFIDLRLSQLMPSDLRGIPYIDGEGIMRFSRPEFLPRGDGKFVLFLDELNMAPPAQQGVAQQLLLDRRVGEHQLAQDTIIFVACNDKSDGAAVSSVPSAVLNRGIHIKVKDDVDSFTHYAMTRPGAIHEDVLAFLNFRPALLHAYEASVKAFPTPRSWEYASTLLRINEPIAAAVGEGAAREFNAFLRLKSKMPPVEKIMEGDLSIPFPDEPSIRYGAVFALIHRAESPTAMIHAFRWLSRQADPEWTTLYVKRVMPRIEAMGLRPKFIEAMSREPRLMEFIGQFRAYMQNDDENDRTVL